MSQILRKVWITELIHPLKQCEKITPDRYKLLQQTYHFLFYGKITVHYGLQTKPCLQGSFKFPKFQAALFQRKPALAFLSIPLWKCIFFSGKKNCAVSHLLKGLFCSTCLQQVGFLWQQILTVHTYCCLKKIKRPILSFSLLLIPWCEELKNLNFALH